MPFFRFHFVESSRLAAVSRSLTDSIGEAIGCPRDHIVLEVIHSDYIGDGEVKDGNDWPFVEVEYFERPREVQEAVAGIVSEALRRAGYPNSDVYFRYLKPENYYENAKSFQSQ